MQKSTTKEQNAKQLAKHEQNNKCKHENTNNKVQIIEQNNIIQTQIKEFSYERDGDGDEHPNTS
jgi:hypothetical protein